MIEDGEMLRALVVATKRIADTLDDYMELTLTAQEMSAMMQARDPAVAAALQPLTDAMERIRTRRPSR